ncbi:MAG: hypothetical protein PWQ42_934 [Sulfurospirillum sp.]|jgi:FtsZ-binding cell division protein ZapB|nr:hypothetical protein [Sulfurospirillum sp.]DAB31163.1 MAG TPA: hypothetical protein CFH79_10545 [Sulfurospirillum sp. UBA11407]DAB33919.1 MAG TPA: hypothetical protein CFH82_08090 [Sulfurospirillum sp. UBA12182]
MFEEENVVGKLSKKIEDLLINFEQLREENSALRQEVVTLKAQNEAKNTQIQRLEEDLRAKEIEADDILGKIEEVLRK